MASRGLGLREAVGVCCLPVSASAKLAPKAGMTIRTYVSRALRITALGFLPASVVVQAQEPAAPAPSANRALVNKYCATCHSERLHTADLMLDKANVDDVSVEPHIWEKAVKKLRAGQMPPGGAPRPDKATLNTFATYLEESLDKAAQANPNPGRTASVHRMNRAEYTNAIRDLLALPIDATSLLPPDNAEYGFDNIGELLAVSPVLMERYMLAAGKIARAAVGDPTQKPVGTTYETHQLLVQEDRASEDLMFGSRGGLAVRHNFLLDGDYEVSVKLVRNNDGFIRGLREPHPLDVRVDGARVKLFMIGGEYPGRSGPIFSRNDPDYRGDPAQVDYEYSADESLVTRFPMKAGMRLVGVSFLKENSKQEGVYMPPLLNADLGQYRGGNPGVASITITGPFAAKGSGETASRQKIFTCYPKNVSENAACSRKVISTLARHAYRKPVTDAEMAPLMKVYEEGAKEGFEAGVQMALQRILAGPEFLLRVEQEPPNAVSGKPYPISDLELASRLSFFLWSSIPDDELISLAEKGRLKDPAVLDQQVKRMLADNKSAALVQNFAGQWLSLRKLKMLSPDPELFPDYDDNLREAFEKESELFFADMLHEDRSVLDMLRADYTYVNERLARHYGIPNVYGSHFRKVSLSDPAYNSRRGVLGQGSVLIQTSRANRTSPVLRGKWVLENLLGTPPPPPPPNVPDLKPKGQDGHELTLKQQMEQHRENAACQPCHKLMDPIGFAMENFDAIGKFRTVADYSDDAPPIDATGVLPDGTNVNGVVEFRESLLKNPRQYLNTVTEKMLTYALGRGVEYYDMPTVRQLLRDAEPGGFRWSSLISGIVKSQPFQMRRAK
jgi:hypothetical protein